MMRNPPPPPPNEGVVPEDDYSTFDAWEGDFDDEPEPEETIPSRDAKMSFSAKGAVPLPPRSVPPRQVPLPPRNEDDVPPPIIPRGGGPPIARQPAVPSFNPKTAMPPSRYRPPSPDDPGEDYLEPSRNSDPEEDEDYLAPQLQEEETYEAPGEEETYEDADEVSSPPARNTMGVRALPPHPGRGPPQPPRAVPQPPHEETYEAPGEEETYEDADEVSSPPARNTMGVRALPPHPGRGPPQPPRAVPQPPHEEYPGEDQTYEDTDEMPRSGKGFRTLPQLPGRAPPPPSNEGECEYQEAEDQTYEDADLSSPPSGMLGQKLPPRSPIEDDYFDDDNDDDGGYAAPEDLAPSRGIPKPGSQQSHPAVPIAPPQRAQQGDFFGRSNVTAGDKKFQQTGMGQKKLFGTDTLRQKRDGLRKVMPTFDKNMNIGNDNHEDDDDDDDDNGQGGIKNILNRLAKKSSMFRGDAKPDDVEQKTKTIPATARSLPQLPQPSRPLPDPSANQSSRSSASSDNSSGSGTFMPRRGSADVPMPVQSQRPLPPIQKQRNIPVEEEIWYFDIERNEVEDKLDRMDGMFLVRRSKLGGPRAPYTLCVFNSTRVYNLNIRYREDETYALGTPHQNEKTFKTVRELIEYHHQHPITLADKERSTVLLKQSPPHDEIYDQTA